MKLIIQSDDLGITEAVSCGIARAAREGAITCTGLFSNMPAAPFAVELMKPYPQICLGEDINLVAGRPCADPEKVPSLVQKNGLFLTSGMHWAIDQKDGDQNHSYSTPATWAAMEAIGRKYSIPLVKEMHKRFGIIRPSRNWNKKPFPLEDQIKADLTECVIGDQEFLNNPISFLGTHCGYVDHELFQVSTYTLIRNQDLAAVTSERFKQWIQENNIELISYRDLKGM